MYTSKSIEKVWLNFKSLFTIFQGSYVDFPPYTGNSAESKKYGHNP